MAEESVVEKLKAQRDRFIAFAFAGADLLLEMNKGDVISYSAGAGEAVYGLSDKDLLGKTLADFIHPRDRKRFDEALLRLRNTGRLDHVPLTLVSSTGAVTRMRMAGIRLPQFPTDLHLSLSRIPPMILEDDARVAAQDPKAKFVELVRQRLNEANRVGEEYTLTLFDFSPTDFTSVEPAVTQSFLATIHHALEQVSVKGASAGPIGDRSFGLVHDQSTSANAVKKKVAEVANQFRDKVPQARLQLRSATLDMEDSALTEDDIGKALSYIVNGFVKNSAQFAVQSLAEGARVAVEDTLVRVRNFRKTVKSDKLIFVFQPIVNLRTGAVLKYEAFARIYNNGTLFPPTQIIPFATDVGVIGEFDLMACKTVLAKMKEAKDISTLANVAINVSGQSLGNPAFYHALLKLLEEHKGLCARLIIEVMDAAQIYNLDEAKRLMLRIRRTGARISLDDFGSGGAAFDILRMLPVDFVKIDPAYIHDARDPKGKSVLRAIVNLCKDLSIVTIGERVEDSSVLKLLKEVGVDYAQGHFFTPPSQDAAKKIKYFTEQVKLAGTAEVALVG